jgi:hypothetical protein
MTQTAVALEIVEFLAFVGLDTSLGEGRGAAVVRLWHGHVALHQ